MCDVPSCNIHNMRKYIYDHRASRYATVFNRERTVRQRGFAEESLLTACRRNRYANSYRVVGVYEYGIILHTYIKEVVCILRGGK